MPSEIQKAMFHPPHPERGGEVNLQKGEMGKLVMGLCSGGSRRKIGFGRAEQEKKCGKKFSNQSNGGDGGNECTTQGVGVLSMKGQVGGGGKRGVPENVLLAGV